MSRIPQVYINELEKTGLPYEIERGKRHNKVFLNGRMITILPADPKETGRRQQNCLAQIRRAARELLTEGKETLH